MEKKVRIFDYKDTPTEITIKDFENVKEFVFEIISGDGILTVVYNDEREKRYDSNFTRIIGFDDGLWVIKPKDIDVLNRMKDHYDTDELNEYDDTL